MSGSNLYASLSSLLAAAVAIAIGISVFLRDRSRDQFRLFAAFCLNLGLFHLARFFAGFPALPLSIWIAQTVSLFLPYTADRCFSGFIPAAGAPPRNVVQAPMLALLLIAQALALIFPTLPQDPWWVIVSVLLPAYVIGGLLYAAMRMWRAARAAEGTAAAPRLRYLFYASLLALALGQPGIPVVGATFTAVYLYFMAQTLVRERLLDLPEILGRITVMTLLVITVTAVYAALLLWVPWRFADEPMLLVFNTLLASFAVLMLVDPLRTELERRLEGWVFRERSALRAILVQLRQRLANVIDPDEMVKAVLGSLRESNRVTRAAFFLVDRQGLALTLRGHLGAPVLERLDLAQHLAGGVGDGQQGNLNHRSDIERQSLQPGCFDHAERKRGGLHPIGNGHLQGWGYDAGNGHHHCRGGHLGNDCADGRRAQHHGRVWRGHQQQHQHRPKQQQHRQQQ